MRIILGLIAITTLGLAAGRAATVSNAPPVLPEVTVQGSALAEEQAVGPYGQPEWTTARRFPTTRVYLQQPPWHMGVEQWVRSKFYGGDRGKHRVQEEFEIGLPHRLQLDLYLNNEINESGTWYKDNVAGEIRWALADWGVIPMNPTAYAEYKWRDTDVDTVEAKLLLGDEFGRGWHWGANAVYEADLGGEDTVELAGSAAVSYALMDRRLSLGVEAVYASESVKDARGEPENSLNIGPSLQWRPTDNSHVDIVPLFGLTEDAPDMMSYLVIGVDFGRGAKTAESMAPTSLRSK